MSDDSTKADVLVKKTTTGSNRALWTVISILCLVNIAMAVVVWGPDSPFHGPHRGDRHDGPPPQELGPHADPFTFLSSIVRMDSAQVQQYATLRDEHRSSMRELRDKLREARRAMFDHISSDNSVVLTTDLAGTTVLQRSIDSVTIIHFRKVRALLRPDQQSRFDAVIGEMSKMMSALPPPHRGGFEREGPPEGPVNASPEDSHDK